jgi:hypothetical protein
LCRRAKLFVLEVFSDHFRISAGDSERHLVLLDWHDTVFQSSLVPELVKEHGWVRYYCVKSLVESLTGYFSVVNKVPLLELASPLVDLLSWGYGFDREVRGRLPLEICVKVVLNITDSVLRGHATIGKGNLLNHNSFVLFYD